MGDEACSDDATPFDIFIIGGGINGCGIARDAAGRGLSVGLAEMQDIGGATSSASTKLFHGGLRYLEYFEFRLVRESLIEREVLLTAMPHISWPMRFVLPYHDSMRFESSTPLARFLTMLCPWMVGRRPPWLIRLGLFIYDRLGGRKILPGTKTIRLDDDVSGEALQSKYKKAFEYSDCWVEDSRLVVLNARDAFGRGAAIMPRTKVLRAERQSHDKDVLWRIETLDCCTGTKSSHLTKFLINAGGPWVEDVIENTIGDDAKNSLRLVRGSHIVTRRLFTHDKSYILQGSDGRIIFAIPYEGDFTLIGTTDVDHPDAGTKPECSPEEKAYLLTFASRYFNQQLSEDDIVATFSGMRPLYNDSAENPAAATRDYTLQFDHAADAPLLNVFGGKITTYRKLAESAVEMLRPFFADMLPKWTAGVALPGGEFAVDGFDALVEAVAEQYPFLPNGCARRLVRAYGCDTWHILGGINNARDLGEDFGRGVFRPELDWVIDKEWVTCAEDFIWRRTRLGLRLTKAQVTAIDKYICQRSMASRGNANRMIGLNRQD